MNKFLTTFKNIWSIEELRTRILNTLLFVAVYRLGAYIILPGVDATKLHKIQGGVLGLLDTFLGGAFSNASIFALGIMPYISASIAIQLLTIVFPYFQKMQKDGDSGRRKLNQITRVLTIAMTAVQSFTYLQTTIPAEALMVDRAWFSIYGVFILVSGTIFCMWMGERITDKGIGNGTSLLIMIGIVSRFPGAIFSEAQTRGTNGLLIFLLEMIALFFVILAAVAITQAVRQVPVQYAKQIVGNKVGGGQRQYLPIKLNSAGVMPIIFAQAIMYVPAFLGQAFADKSELANAIATAFNDYTNFWYNFLFAFLIIIFTFFYTAIAINPQQISDDMKRGGGFIPGIKPGQATTDFLSTILDRVTLPGGILLAAIAIAPAIAVLFGVSSGFSQFFGGTSLLILVGVVLDTLQQIESYLLMRRYEGLMKSGRVTGRTDSVSAV